MKHILICIIFYWTFLSQVIGQEQIKNKLDTSKTSIYINDIYRFSANIPGNWRLFGQIKNDIKNHRAIVSWSLPSIYSDLEKTNIENAISITAYQRTEIHSLGDLILSEYLRINPTETAMEIDKENSNARIIYNTKNGLKYKGKSYFVFNNEIGYVITFMATPGTYDKNIKVFEEFYCKVKFL